MLSGTLSRTTTPEAPWQVVEASDGLAREATSLRNAVAFENPDIDPMAVTLAGTPERCAERINALTEAGVSHFVVEFQFHGLETVEFGMRQMETFAREVGPLL